MEESTTLINTPLQWGVRCACDDTNRFSGFHSPMKTAEAVRSSFATKITPLKWGVTKNRGQLDGHSLKAPE
jgi:hypothetical protein